MPTSKRLRSDDIAGGGTPAPLVSGGSRAHEITRANMGAADVRGDSARTTVITLQAFAGTDSFKLGAYGSATGHPVAGAWSRTDTAAFVRGTNATAAAIQTALRTATGDTTLTVAGDTDAGPFTVTWVGLKGQPELVALTMSACSVQIAPGTLSYTDVDHTGTAGTVPTTNGIAYDQLTTKGFGRTIPLGYSTDTKGTGQTRGVALLPITVDSAVGGTGEVVIAGTEVASAGTDAVALYGIRKLDLADHATQWVTVDSEDADGDVTISSLSAGNYVLSAHSQTQAADATTGAQISGPANPVYFTVS